MVPPGTFYETIEVPTSHSSFFTFSWWGCRSCNRDVWRTKGFEDLPIEQWKKGPSLLRVLIGDYTIQLGGDYFHDIRIRSWNNQDSMERIRRGFFVAQLGWCWFFLLVYMIPMDAYEVKAIQIENSAHMLSFYDLSDVGSFPLPKCIRLKIDVPPRSGCMLELTSSRFGGSRISFTYTRISPKKNRLDLNASLRCSSCVHNERKIIVEDIQGCMWKQRDFVKLP